MFSRHRGRRFSHTKFALLLIVVFGFEHHKESYVHKKRFERDLDFCPTCFQTQLERCLTFFEELQFPKDFSANDLLNLLLPRFGDRDTHLLQLNDSKRKIVSKYSVNDHSFEKLRPNLDPKELSPLFFRETRLDGFQYCPDKTIGRFVDYFTGTVTGNRTISPRYDELTIWLYMLFNVQAILLPHLFRGEFAVPKTVAVCGLTTFQEYAGRTVNYYYNAEFRVRASIAKQLLEAALKFSHGFDGFRIYITDLNADNIVYDDSSDELYFVDLDTVYIVDSRAETIDPHSGIHRHGYIDCDDCFAYSPQDICAHRLSDINLYAACQLLRENLRKDRTKGFLHPIPHEVTVKYPTLMQLLDMCVDCALPACKDRFAVSLDLISVLDEILLFFL